jgi:glucose/arabinose dehydrogenase/PKD repeat protein
MKIFMSGNKPAKESKMRRVVLLVVGFAFALAACSTITKPELALAQSHGVFVPETVLGGLVLPTSVAFAPDGRIFIAEKRGVVRVVENGVLLSEPVITLTDINDYSDRGLLGIAVHPEFSSNGHLFLSYTYENDRGSYSGPKTGRIVRVTVTGNRASYDSMEVLVGTVGGDPERPSCEDYARTVDCIPSDSSTHSVGGLRFGPDGNLYASLGDGAPFETANRLALRAIDLDSLAGKVIRIRTDGTGLPDNPFYTGDPDANASKVWAYGFRNPYRFNFRDETGALYIGDVGWYSWEEINISRTGGENFGWPCFEGPERAPGYDQFTECQTMTGHVGPLHAYPHEGEGFAVTAGTFPGFGAYPAEFSSSYFFADFSRGFFRRLEMDSADRLDAVIEMAARGAGGPVDIVTGPDGYIYYLSIYSGELRRLVYTEEGRVPIARASGYPLQGDAPLEVSFSSEGSYDPDGGPISFYWDFGDGNVSTEAFPTHTYTAEGRYTVVLTVTDEDRLSATDTLMVHVGVRAEDVDPVVYNVTYGPTPVYTGRPVDITVDVQNRGEPAPVIVNIEIYNEYGERVAQRYWDSLADGIRFETGEIKSFTFAGWLAEGTGVHRVAVGLVEWISDGVWGVGYVWEGEAAQIEVLQRSPGDPIPGEIEPVLESVTVAPSAPSVGEATTVSTTVRNDGDAGVMVVNVEIFDSTGTQVYQRFFEDEVFAGGETKTLSFEWTPSTAGTYGIAVGLFSQGWTELYGWYSDATTVSVGGGGGDPIPGEIEPVLESVTVAPSAPSVGEATTVSTTVRNNGDAGVMVVNVEIFDSTGTQVYQRFFEDEVFAGRETKTLSFAWTPSMAGTYGIAVGLFSQGWTELYGWYSDATTVSVGGGGGDPIPGEIEPVLESVTVAPSAPSVGEATTVSTTVRNNGDAGVMVVNVEIFDSTGTQVYQRFFEDEVFAGRETKTLSFAWTPSMAGTYGIAVGLFSQGWTELYGWYSDATTVSVGD